MSRGTKKIYVLMQHFYGHFNNAVHGYTAAKETIQ